MKSARFEVQYLVPEQRTDVMRQFLRSYVVPDQPAERGEHGTYDVHSLYLDSPDVVLCRNSHDGAPNRFVLRIRFYGADSRQPVFLEIKRRTGELVTKDRAVVTREGALGLLRQRRLDPAQLLDRSPATEAAVHAFLESCRKLGARAHIYVSYQREAYSAPQNAQLRVTFDRQLSAAPFRPSAGLTAPITPQPVTMGGVIVGLKFTERFPRWMQELVYTFNLSPCTPARYARCVAALDAPPRGRVQHATLAPHVRLAVGERQAATARGWGAGQERLDFQFGVCQPQVV